MTLNKLLPSTYQEQCHIGSPSHAALLQKWAFKTSRAKFVADKAPGHLYQLVF